MFEEIEKCIKELCGDAQVHRNASISYIKTLTEEDKFIFVCCETQYNKKTTNYEESINGSFDSSKLLDLTGSPLKDNCQLDDFDADLSSPIQIKYITSLLWKKEEQNFLPIELDKARLIVTYLSMDHNLRRSSKDSIWILCNGSDNRHTILLRYKFSSVFNQRSVVFYNGIIPVDNLNISEMIATHLKEIGGNNGMINRINTTFEYTFNVSSNSYLKVMWDSISFNPSLNNFKNSDIILYQSIEVNKPSSAMEDIWNEFTILYAIRNHILDYNAIRDKDELYYSSGEYMDLDCIREKILVILTDVTELQDEEININNREIEIIVKSVRNRLDLDVTDQLWDVLKYCSNYNDLKSAINFIFYCAAKFNVINMPTNKNYLAILIREVSQRRLAIPCLNGTEPLELLLEIGLEKLSKDYEYIFSTSKICSVNQMMASNLKRDSDSSAAANLEKNARKSLFSAKHIANNNTPFESISNSFHGNDKVVEGFQNSKFNKNNVDNEFSRLIQSHLILEHLLLIQIHLNMESVYSALTEQLLRKPLKSFENVLRNSVDKIELAIAFDDVFNFLNHKAPEIRKITMNSKNNFKEIRSTFYFNENHIFPPEIFPDIKTDEKEFSKKNMYYSWRYVDIKTKIN